MVTLYESESVDNIEWLFLQVTIDGTVYERTDAVSSDYTTEQIEAHVLANTDRYEREALADVAAGIETRWPERIKPLGQLKATDTEMVRVIEDIWDILKTKNLVTDDDLNEFAKNKLVLRKKLREEL